VALVVDIFPYSRKHSTVASLPRHPTSTACTVCSNKDLAQDRRKGFKTLFWTPVTRSLRDQYLQYVCSRVPEHQSSKVQHPTQLRWPHHVYPPHTAFQVLTDGRQGNRVSTLITLASYPDSHSTCPLCEALRLHRVRLHKI
jgi:hypothetical protein